MEQRGQRGFTLIELSIVLVIIGLIVGGVLTGRDLIKAAEVRAQISQVEKYNSAANTFFGKYGYLPGDIPAAPAAQFGFAARGPYVGEGDANGAIEGNTGNCSGCDNSGGVYGETTLFWVDLSAAHLIDGGFTIATATTTAVFGPPTNQWLPQAKINPAAYVYVAGFVGTNRFYVSGPIAIGSGGNMNGGGTGGPFYSISVYQAYSIDKKIDDGLPGTGTVRAELIHPYPQWAGGGVFNILGDDNINPPGTYSAFPATAQSCMDNGNTVGASFNYSLSQNSGNGANCALSFKMQAGD